MISIDLESLDNFNILPEFSGGRASFKLICVKDQAYLLGGYGNEPKPNGYFWCFTEKYSLANNTWEFVDNIHVNDDHAIAACSFMDSIYLMNRYNGGIEFNTKTQKSKTISKMNDERRNVGIAELY